MLDAPPATGRALDLLVRDALQAVASDPYMRDPSLRERLAAITAPTLVLWGESDGVVTPDYGRAFAAAAFTVLDAFLA